MKTRLPTAALCLVALATNAAPPKPAAGPPPPAAEPALDTARYLAWMKDLKKPITDTPWEDVRLRLGGWGFFSHGDGPGQFLDKLALDKAGHELHGSEDGDWYVFLTTRGVDAAGALQRLAWLYSAAEVTGELKTAVKTTPPTLTTADGAVVLEGWLVFPPNLTTPMKLTLTATLSSTKIALKKQ